MTINEIKELKEQYGFSCQMIADKSKVPMSTVLKIFSGSIKNPRASTISKLSKGMLSLQLESVRSEMEGRKELGISNVSEPEDMFREAVQYGAGSNARNMTDSDRYNTYKSQQEKQIITSKKPGDFTIGDLKDMPEGIRYEIFNGKLIKMDSPTTLHQLLSSEIFFQIRTFIQNNNRKCIPYMAPLDVQFDDEGKNVFEPDIFVVCKGKPTFKRIYGVPDFIIEIVSPSNRKYDMQDKLSKYTEFGVREYWIVDPYKRSIVVHDLENCGIAIYSFEDSVPVSIYNDELKIDFKSMPDYIKNMYDENGTVIDN